eukprot:403349363
MQNSDGEILIVTNGPSQGWRVLKFMPQVLQDYPNGSSDYNNPINTFQSVQLTEPNSIAQSIETITLGGDQWYLVGGHYKNTASEEYSPGIALLFSSLQDIWNVYVPFWSPLNLIERQSGSIYFYDKIRSFRNIKTMSQYVFGVADSQYNEPIIVVRVCYGQNQSYNVSETVNLQVFVEFKIQLNQLKFIQ